MKTAQEEEVARGNTGWTAYWQGLASTLRKLHPCAEIVTHGDSSFTESPEVGGNLMAHRENMKTHEADLLCLLMSIA